MLKVRAQENRRTQSKVGARFAKFLAGSSAVHTGSFVLKSGARSNVFFNIGALNTGRELATLGSCFAMAAREKDLLDVDVIFGPAYKGINIAIAMATALYLEHGIDLPVAYNRKVVKNHGEGGGFVGYDLNQSRRVLVVDDVITDGLTKYECISMLRNFPDLSIEAFLIGVDREDVDENGVPLKDIFIRDTGLNLYSLTTKTEVSRFLPVVGADQKSENCVSG